MVKVIAVALVLAFSQLSVADDLTDEKKGVIDEMLEITGALKIAELMGNAVADQTLGVLAKTQKIEPNVVAAIRDETNKIMHEEFIESRFMHEMSYEIYHKYFSTDELKDVVAFYKTPTGRKMTKHLPQITQEAMLAGQQHAISIQPKIERRLAARLKEEGIE